MPNFVTNIVHFDGDPERILDLRGAVQDDQYLQLRHTVLLWPAGASHPAMCFRTPSGICSAH